MLAVACVTVPLGSATALAAGNPPVNGALPVISGTVRQGQTLSATSGSWAGTAPISFSYRWQRCNGSGAGCGGISGATATTYTLTSQDVNHTIRVNVTAQNADGTAQALSAATSTVASLGSTPANTKQPNPSGTAKEGSTVSVNNGNWSGSAPISFAYQWQRCVARNGKCGDIAGATSHNYTATSADIGYTLRAGVIASNTAGRTTAYSNLTGTVAAKDAPPVNTALPVVAGNPVVGQTLVAANGSWKGASGVYGYQWIRCTSSGSCADLPGATGQTYVVAAADAGNSLEVRVRASNNVGATSATSTAVLVGTPVAGGFRSVPVTSLAPHPDHLLISSVQFSPSPFRTRGGVITARVRVTVEGTNKVVSGALVYIVGIPYAWVVRQPELPTGADGTVTFHIRTTRAMVLSRGGALVMQVRARAPGTGADVILGGISTRRLVQVTLAPPR